VYPKHPQRLKTFDYLGPHRYFLTFCTFDRHPAFVRSERVDLARSHFLRAAADEAFALVAYCFMPDHVHLLAEGLEAASDGRRFISHAKQLSGYQYQRACGARLWQRYGYERTLRDEDDTMSVVKCILENPVRAGLVKCPEDYPFIGSTRHTREELIEAIQLRDVWRPNR
jgi:putative transposase